jgi:hypothetical protein
VIIVPYEMQEYIDFAWVVRDPVRGQETQPHPHPQLCRPIWAFQFRPTSDPKVAGVFS